MRCSIRDKMKAKRGRLTLRPRVQSETLCERSKRVRLIKRGKHLQRFALHFVSLSLAASPLIVKVEREKENIRKKQRTIHLNCLQVKVSKRLKDPLSPSFSHTHTHTDCFLCMQAYIALEKEARKCERCIKFVLIASHGHA